MKHLLFFSLALLFTISACDKIPDNNDINGSWQLLEFYTTDPNVEPYVASYGYYSKRTDKRESHTYWNFQLGLLQIISDDLHNGFTNQSFAKYTLKNDMLQLNGTYIHYRDRDSLIIDPTGSNALQSIGIWSTTDEFVIQKLTSTDLILTTRFDSLIFRKIH